MWPTSFSSIKWIIGIVMIDSPLVKRLFQDEDMRGKLYVVFWLASVCAMISLFIGGLVFIVLVLRSVGLLPF